MGESTTEAFGKPPYGTTKAYREGIETADLEKLVELVKVVGVLLQMKIYLFWMKKTSA